MKTCAVVGCEKQREGNTLMCASCNRNVRKQLEQSKKEEQRAWAKVSMTRKPQKPIAKVSAKRKVLNDEYAILRERFLLENPTCNVQLIGCQRVSMEVHHKASGSNKVKNLNNVKTWLPVCAHCHRLLHDKLSAKEARSKGLKI